MVNSPPLILITPVFPTNNSHPVSDISVEFDFGKAEERDKGRSEIENNT